VRLIPFAAPVVGGCFHSPRWSEGADGCQMCKNAERLEISQRIAEGVEVPSGKRALALLELLDVVIARRDNWPTP